MSESKLTFSGTLGTKKGNLSARLQVYSFIEDGMYITYCPALDLSAYGNTEEDAKKAFEQNFAMHFSYCINKDTLYNDLKAHGWDVRGKKSKDLKAPKFDDMLKSNDTLNDILRNKEYSKYDKEVLIPEFA